MRYGLFVLLVFALVLSSCTKEDEQTEPSPLPPTSNSDSTDLLIRFTTYQPGITYQNDTIRNVFEIVNNGPTALRAGDRLRTACRIGGVTFALDLIGPGPTDLVLASDLPVGASYMHNPGYLLGPSLLDYFGTDTVELCVMVYGFNNAMVDPAFPSDPAPANNSACVRYSAAGIVLQ
jgi:hypothetical protein